MSSVKLHLALLAAAAGSIALATPSQAQDRSIGEIFAVAYTYCPRDTVPAFGQVVPIQQYPALAALYGNRYGGNGVETFGIPDMRGRLPMHAGRGPGLSARDVGNRTGTPTVQLSDAHLPPHNHEEAMQVVRANATSADGAGLYLGRAVDLIYEEATQPTGDTMAKDAIVAEADGLGQPLVNMQPSLSLTYCVVFNGVFPSRP